MTDYSPNTSPSATDTVRSPMRLYPWFICGFSLVFIAILLFMTQHTMHSSGRYVVEYKLWHYYYIEIRRASAPVKTLGPTTGSEAAALLVFVQHVAVSTVGGLLFLGVGAIVRRMRK